MPLGFHTDRRRGGARDERLQRVARQRGWSELELAERERAQMPLTEKAARADHVLQNTGSFEQLDHQVADLDTAAALGALAMALVELRVDGRPRRFAVPWRSMPWRERGTGGSVGLEELAGFEIQPGRLYLEPWL